MFPFWSPYPFAPVPYWYNYYYYFYRHPSMSGYDEDEYEEEHEHHREEENNKISTEYQSSEDMYRWAREEKEDDRQMPSGGQYTPGAPTQFPIGTSGHYGSAPEVNPIGQFTPSSGTEMSPQEILTMIETDDPGIIRTMATHGVPLTSARQFAERIIQATLRYCRR